MVFAFDTLSYAKHLQLAGVSTQEAEAHAEAVREFIMAELVTKADMDLVHQQFTSVHKQFATVHAELGFLREEVAAVRREFREDTAATKRDLQDSMLSLRREMTALIANSELRVTVRLGLLMAVGIGILAALIKL
ncbi:MAG: hypothetical protein ACJ8AI_04430 [Rhodopila sp.]